MAGDSDRKLLNMMLENLPRDARMAFLSDIFKTLPPDQQEELLAHLGQVTAPSVVNQPEAPRQPDPPAPPTAPEPPISPRAHQIEPMRTPKEQPAKQFDKDEIQALLTQEMKKFEATVDKGSSEQQMRKELVGCIFLALAAGALLIMASVAGKTIWEMLGF